MSSSAVDHGRAADEWGPVRRGFGVWLADGRRGSVADIRRSGGGGVELVVVTGLFFRTLVTVRPTEIEAILPGLRRIIVRQPDGARQETCGDDDVEGLGDVLRLPVRRAPSIDSPPDAA